MSNAGHVCVDRTLERWHFGSAKPKSPGGLEVPRMQTVYGLARQRKGRNVDEMAATVVALLISEYGIETAFYDGFDSLVSSHDGSYQWQWYSPVA